MTNVIVCSDLDGVRAVVGGVFPAGSLRVKGSFGSVSDSNVLVLGAANVDKLRGLGVVHKTKKLSGLRESVYQHNGNKILVSYDPAVRFFRLELLDLLKYDIRLFKRLCVNGNLNPILGDYKYVDGFSEAVSYCKTQIRKGVRPLVSIDLETMGLDPFNPDKRILTVQVSFREGMAHVYYVPEDGLPTPQVIEDIRFLCTNAQVKTTGANLKFDSMWIYQKWGFQIENQTFDTYLVGSLLEENRDNSLEYHSKVFTDLGGYDSHINTKYDKSRMELIPRGELLPYAGGDSDACLRVTKVFRKELIQDKKLCNFYINLLHPASKAFISLENRGVVVDKDRFKKVGKQLDNAKKNVEDRVKEFYSVRLIARHGDKCRLTRPDVIRDILFSPMGFNLKPTMFTPKSKHGKPVPSTASNHLTHLRESYCDNEDLQTFLDLIKEFNTVQKSKSTYIAGFLKHLRSDGRFHPSYMQGVSGLGGTVTGRLSAKDPAWQTIPKRSKYAKILRSCYIPPEGYAILKLDYSQGELRIAACLSNDPKMIKAYRDNKDLHLITACGAAKRDYDRVLLLPEGEREALRFGGKAGNFGLIYGMSPPGFVVYARDTYGVKMTLQESEDFCKGYYDLYTRIKPWHMESIDFAKRNKMIRSPLGRVRHLWNINSRDGAEASKQQRQAINSPVQSCLSDMSQLAMSILVKEYPELWIFGMTHDEIQFYVPVDDLDVWAKRIKDVMENLPLETFGWRPQLKFTVDAEFSLKNLGACEKMSIA